MPPPAATPRCAVLQHMVLEHWLVASEAGTASPANTLADIAAPLVAGKELPLAVVPCHELV